MKKKHSKYLQIKGISVLNKLGRFTDYVRELAYLNILLPFSQYWPSNSRLRHSQMGPESVDIQIPPCWHGSWRSQASVILLPRNVLLTFSRGGSPLWSQGPSPHLMSRGCFISCRRVCPPGWSAYTRFLIEPRKRGSKMTLGKASKANFVLYQCGIPPTKTSEFVVNLPNWNSLPFVARLCETPSTISEVCSSLRNT